MGWAFGATCGPTLWHKRGWPRELVSLCVPWVARAAAPCTDTVRGLLSHEAAAAFVSLVGCTGLERSGNFPIVTRLGSGQRDGAWQCSCPQEDLPSM